MIFLNHLINKQFYILFFVFNFIICCFFVYLLAGINPSFLEFPSIQKLLENWGPDEFILKMCVIVTIYCFLHTLYLEIKFIIHMNVGLIDNIKNNKTIKLLSLFWSALSLVSVIYILINGSAYGDEAKIFSLIKSLFEGIEGYLNVVKVQFFLLVSLFLAPDLILYKKYIH